MNKYINSKNIYTKNRNTKQSGPTKKTMTKITTKKGWYNNTVSVVVLLCKLRLINYRHFTQQTINCTLLGIQTKEIYLEYSLCWNLFREFSITLHSKETPEGFGVEFIKPLTVIASETHNIIPPPSPVYKIYSFQSTFSPETLLTRLQSFPSIPLLYTLATYPSQLFLTFGK